MGLEMNEPFNCMFGTLFPPLPPFHPTLPPSSPLPNRALARQSQSELSPVCAVVGGILGQEILKAISRKGEPALNVFLWDGATHEGRVIAVPPPKEKE
jgi:hypothetical protein